MRGRPGLLAGLWLMLPWVGGCAGVTLVPRALDEAVKVEQMNLAFGPDGTGTLILILSVENPTVWNAKVTGVDFELRLDGRRYAVGTRGAGLMMSPGGQSGLWVAFPLSSQPTRDEGPPHLWRVDVRGGVALAFGEMVRLLPFRTERELRLPYFRPVEPEPE